MRKPGKDPSYNEKGTTASSTLGMRIRLDPKAVEDYAVKAFQKCHDGITVPTLARDFHRDSKKVKRWVYRSVKRGIFFTRKEGRTCPQTYYPSAIEAEVCTWFADQAKKGASDPIGIRGAGKQRGQLQSPTLDQKATVIANMLEISPLGLDLIAGKPIKMHNLRFYNEIPPEYYDQLSLATTSRNKGKVHIEKLGKGISARYTFSPNGTVEVIIVNSKAPLDVGTEEDIARFFVFLGRIEDRQALFLRDYGFSGIQDATNWYWTYLERNIDVPTEHWRLDAPFCFTVQDLHLMLKVYVKALEKDVVMRFELNGKGIDKQKVIEVAKDMLSPSARLERIEEYLISIEKQTEFVGRILGNCPFLIGTAPSLKEGSGLYQ